MTTFDDHNPAPIRGTITRAIKHYFALPNLGTEDLGGIDLS